MSGGYVMDFTNQTFREFISDAIGIDVYDEKYNSRSGSKANRLRALWEKESDYRVGKLLEKLLEYWRLTSQTGEIKCEPSDEVCYKACLEIVDALQSENRVENSDALQTNSADPDFSELARSIRADVEDDKPGNALDRLHTYMTKYMRRLCNQHGVDYNKHTPLHGLMGSYIKALDKNGAIESEMTRQILKTSILYLESYNEVRNEKSFAHANPVLNRHESVLIINNILNLLRFLQDVERR